MWNRDKELRFLTHRLCSCMISLKDTLSLNGKVYIMNSDAGELGIYKELAVLPDKIARYLYGYHSESYALLGLPLLPVDRSDVDVHEVLKPQQVLPVFSYVWIVYL